MIGTNPECDKEDNITLDPVPIPPSHGDMLKALDGSNFIAKILIYSIHMWYVYIKC